MREPGAPSDLDDEEFRQIAAEVGLDPREVRAAVRAAQDGASPLASASPVPASSPGPSTVPPRMRSLGEVQPPLASQTSRSTTVDPALAPQIKSWADRLIERTRNNRLLFFDATKPNCQPIVMPGASHIWEVLTGSERAMEIWLPRPPARSILTVDAAGADEAAKLDNTPLEDVVSREALREHQLLLGSRSVKQTRVFATRLYRKAAEEMNERGLQVAYLTFGLVRWRDDSREEEGACPLFLVPVLVERENPNAPFTIRSTGDEPVLNPVLRAHVARLFSLELPAFEEPADGDDTLASAIAPYVAALNHRGLSFEHGCWLGYFSFHKLIMFQDLIRNAGRAASSPLLRQLTGNVESLGGGAPAVEAREVDALFDPLTSFQVRDADSSQQACIEMAKRGDSLVIVGPPGTGKSQTIANIVAELLGQGKTVLFVAEKMAALEVVHRRLTEDGLGDFCLELHSHKAHKKAVIEELARTLGRDPSATTVNVSTEVARWHQVRSELNAYVAALHERREPLGASPFAILGKLASLKDAPAVVAQIPDADVLTPEVLAKYRDLAVRVAQCRVTFADAARHPWQGFKRPAPGLADMDVLRSETASRAGEAQALRRELDTYLDRVGLTKGSDPDWAWLRHLAELLDQGVGCEPRWLVEDDVDRLLAKARELARRSNEAHEARQEVARSWQQGIWTVRSDWATRCRELEKRLAALSQAPLQGDLLVSWPRLGRVVVGAPEAATALVAAYDAVRETLGLDSLPAEPEPAVVQGLEVVLSASLGRDRIEPAWAGRDGWEEAERSWLESKPAIVKWQSLRAELRTRWSLAILDADLTSAGVGFAGPYLNASRFLRPSFWRDRKLLIGLSAEGRLPESTASDVRAVRAHQEERRALEQALDRGRRVLGPRFEGIDSDVALLDSAIGKAHAIRSLDPTHDWSAISRRIYERRDGVNLEGLLTRLRATAEGWRELRDLMSNLWVTPPKELATFRGFVRMSAALESLAAEAAPLRHEIVGFWTGTHDLRMEDVEAVLGLRQRVERFDEELSGLDGDLRRAWGGSFTGRDTDWVQLIRKLEWCAAVVSHFARRPIPHTFAERVAVPGPAMNVADVTALVDRWKNLWRWLGTQFDLPAVQRGASWASDFGVTETATWVRGCAERIDDLSAWCSFRDLSLQFDSAGLGSWLKGAGTMNILQAQIWPALERSLYAAWYDAVAAADSRIGSFESQHQGLRIAAFRELDASLKTWAKRNLAARLAAEQPRGVAFMPGGQLGILKKEATKKKRQMALPKLFSRAPNIIQQLKPCLLMSPISVAQFLNAEVWNFDAVIFDEASQLCVEDSVGCLMRARQAIVVGDPKQLPPTSFFKASDEDEASGEDSELGDDGDYSSLVDAGRARWREKRLRWHYRSRHDSLIAFSNDRFYGNDLIIFPSTDATGKFGGVSLRHVADGVYDRGKSATNLKEAEVVADLVLEHMRRYGRDVSLGVIAFSVQQAHLIEDVLNERRRLRPEAELDPCFARDGSEPFFVKNLENVQGDERDVVLISVGYGKDAGGELAYNFGPLNQKGGANRLNVAVTRAKDRIVLVSSIRALDFDPSRVKSEGARLLRDYLAFAEQGIAALRSPEEPMGYSVGDIESEFERSVAGALRGMGYRVVPQVGCGSFRIDLGVMAPGDDGRYLLGVECDGAQYHGAATARDRDRLRDEVLEQVYGWTLFRIWGPDWVKSRDAVMKRLSKALDDAQGRQKTSDPAQKFPRSASSSGPASHSLGGAAPVAASPTATPVAVLEIASRRFGVPYETAELTTGPHAFEFHEPAAMAEHRRLLLRLVAIEGPIHFDHALARLRDAWGLKRIGVRMETAIAEIVRELQAAGHIDVRREGDDRFLWSVDTTPKLPRWPDDEGERRPFEWIALEEVIEALTRIVVETYGTDADELMRGVTRYFGWQQLTENMRLRIEVAIERAIATGGVQRRGSDLLPPTRE